MAGGGTTSFQEPLPGDDGITPGLLLQAIRQNLPLFVISAGLTLALAALVLLGSPSDYSARAVIRMASERRTLTSGVEDAPRELDRPVDPTLSAVQVLTSRTLVGSVVDSLGLRLQPVNGFTLGSPLFGRNVSDRRPPCGGGRLQRFTRYSRPAVLGPGWLSAGLVPPTGSRALASSCGSARSG
jgi:Uncharacterized protein involved in exopolysaccharide biosynthesis